MLHFGKQLPCHSPAPDQSFSPSQWRSFSHGHYIEPTLSFDPLHYNMAHWPCGDAVSVVRGAVSLSCAAIYLFAAAEMTKTSGIGRTKASKINRHLMTLAVVAGGRTRHTILVYLAGASCPSYCASSMQCCDASDMQRKSRSVNCVPIMSSSTSYVAQVVIFSTIPLLC